MNMLTKQDKKDIKEIFVDALVPFATAIQTDFNKVHDRLDTAEIEMKEAQGRLTNVESTMQDMKTNSSELFTKIDIFTAAVNQCNQETTVLAGQVRHLNDRVLKIESRK